MPDSGTKRRCPSTSALAVCWAKPIVLRVWSIALARSDYTEAQQRCEAALPLYQWVSDVLGEANCIQDLGDIALAHSKHQEAHKAFEAALTLYTRIPEPYSIGQTHRRLARLSPDGAARMRHVQAARAAWERIDRPDLLAELEREFGT